MKMISFSDLNPAVITVWFLSVSAIAMFCNHPVITALTMAGSVLFYIIRNKGGHFRSHLFFLLLFLILSLANPIVSHNGATVLFVMNDNPVTLESLLYGINSSAMIVGVLYLLRSFTQIMTSEKLLYVTGRLSPKLSMILSMAIRFVPLFSKQGQKVNDTQKVLGLYKDDNFIDDLKGHLRVFSIVSTWGLENGIITADSMEARGYGTGRRTQMTRFGFTFSDASVLAASLALTALCAAAIAAGKIAFTFYPKPEAADCGILGIVGFAAYALLVFMPLFIETEVKLRWNYLMSKM